MMFSLIVPVYNVEPYLRECLDSVLVQTFATWECLCVDDGSTDGSGAILDDYATRDNRFRVFHKEHGGVGSARNLALDHTRGEWVWFVDADDVIHPDALFAFRDAIDANPGACTLFLQYMYGNRTPPIWPVDENELAHSFPVPCDAGLARLGYGMCSYVLRLDAVGGIRFESFARGEDSVFMTAFAARAFGLVDLRRQLYFYRQRPDSAVHSAVSEAVVRETLLAQRRQIENLAHSLSLLGNIPAPTTWAGWFRTSYKSYFGMLFQLSARSRQRLIPLWLSNLDLVRQHYCPPADVRIRLALIRFTRSGWLLPHLAFGRIPGLFFSIRMCHRIRNIARTRPKYGG